MQVVDDFLQGFLGFVLSGHILEGDAGLGGNVHLGIALAEAHHIAATDFRSQIPHEQLPDDHKDQERQDPVVEEADNGRFLLGNHLGEFHLGLHQTAHQLRIIHPARHIDLLFVVTVIAQQSDPVLGDFHFFGLALIHHAQEIGVTHFMDLGLEEHGTDDRIDDQDQQDGRYIIHPYMFGLLIGIFVIHGISSFPQVFCMFFYDYSTNPDKE